MLCFVVFQIESEFLSMFALKIWKHYLYGEKSEVYHDHKSPKYTFMQRDFNKRQRQWMKYLKQYNFDLQYHPGKADIVVDALSHKTRFTLACLLYNEWNAMKTLGKFRLEFIDGREWVLVHAMLVQPKIVDKIIKSLQDNVRSIEVCCQRSK